MSLHYLPSMIWAISFCCFFYELGYYKNVRDPLYGMSCFFPLAVAAVVSVLYYGLFCFFKYIVGF